MHHGVVRRIEAVALGVLVGQHRHRAVVLVAHHPAVQVLAGYLPALEVEGVAVAVAGGRPEAPADLAGLLDPTELHTFREVTPDTVRPAENGTEWWRDSGDKTE